MLCRKVKIDGGLRLTVPGHPPIEVRVGKDPDGKSNQVMLRLHIDPDVKIETISRFAPIPVKVNHVLSE